MSLAQQHVVLTLPVAGTLTTGAKPGVALPFPAELVAITANVGTAPTGAALTFNVTKNGTSVTGTNTNPDGPVSIAISATKPSAVVKADAGVAAFDSNNPGANNVYAPIVNDGSAITTFAANDVVAVNIAQVGSTVAGADLTVTLHLIKK